MGLQLLVQSESEAVVESLLGSIAERAEVFHVEGALWGISIPTKLVDEVGEEGIRQRLSRLNVYSLYEGQWKYA
jgi:hypothetical protein